MDFSPCPRIKFALNTQWKRTYDGVIHLSDNFKIDTDQYMDHYHRCYIIVLQDLPQIEEQHFKNNMVYWSIGIACQHYSFACMQYFITDDVRSFT